MKRLVFAVLALFSVTAYSAPFVVGDVVPTVTECRVFMDGVEVAIVPAQAPGTCGYDLAGISNGQHSVTMTSIATDPVWGVQESVQSVPLDFVKPGPPTAPAMRLSPTNP